MQRKRQRVEADFGEDDGVPFTTFPTSPGLSFMHSQSSVGYPNLIGHPAPSLFGGAVQDQPRLYAPSPISAGMGQAGQNMGAGQPMTEDLLYQLQNLLTLQGGPPPTAASPAADQREPTPGPPNLPTDMIYSQLQQLIELQRMQVCFNSKRGILNRSLMIRSAARIAKAKRRDAGDGNETAFESGSTVITSSASAVSVNLWPHAGYLGYIRISSEAVGAYLVGLDGSLEGFRWLSQV